MFPNFLNQCLSLKNILTPIAYLLITGGWIATTLAGYQSGSTHFRAVGKIIVLLMLLVFLPTWGNQIVSAMDDLVENVLNVDPAKIHDQYQAALQLKKSPDGNSSWWEKVFNFPSITEALMTFAFMILGWLASTIEWWAYILQSAILFIGYALSPIFIGTLAFPSVQQIGRRYLMTLVGVMAWPLGWGVAGLITQGVLNFMTDRSFLSYQGVISGTGGEIGYSLQNLMGLAFLGVWIIFSTIAAPTIIQRAVSTGTSAASDLFSGAFTAGYSAGKAGVMSLADSIGGQNITKGTIKSLTAKAMTGAAASGGAAAAVAGMTALETLVTASINEGRGGDSVVGSLARMRNSFRDKDNSSGGSNQNPRKGGIPAEDVSGDKTVGDLIRKSKNPES